MMKEQEQKNPMSIGSSSELIPQLPTFLLNKKRKAISVNGRIAEIKGESAWQILLFLSLNSSQGFNKVEIRKGISKNCPTFDTSKMDVLSLISDLRGLIEVDSSHPEILVGTIREEQSKWLKYSLNANVEFVDDSFGLKNKETIPREKDLGLLEAKAIQAFFDLKKDNSGFEYASVEDVMFCLYGEKILHISDPNEKKKRISNHINIFLPQLRKAVIGKLSEVWEMSLDKINSPRLAKTIKWLKEQPIYAKATLDDLTLVAERKMSFEDLSRRINSR